MHVYHGVGGNETKPHPTRKKAREFIRVSMMENEGLRFIPYRGVHEPFAIEGYDVLVVASSRAVAQLRLVLLEEQTARKKDKSR